jgi:hypothetical protein
MHAAAVAYCMPKTCADAAAETCTMLHLLSFRSLCGISHDTRALSLSVQANESKSQRGFKRLARDADEAKQMEQNI